MRENIFRRLEAPGRNYEKTMINNMDSLYGVIRKYRDYNIRVCRTNGILPSDIDSVVSEVIGNLSKQYDNRNIIELGLLLLPPFMNPVRKRTIHSCLVNCNEFQVICSGMIAKAFQRVGYSIVPVLGPIPADGSNQQHNSYGASLIMRHYSQIMPKHFEISPNFQIIKFNIIEDGEFNYKALWAQTIFETRYSKIEQITDRENSDSEPIPAH